jgi:hypothetical protein
MVKDMGKNSIYCWGASLFCKSITQSKETARVLDPFKMANLQKWDAPKLLLVGLSIDEKHLLETAAIDVDDWEKIPVDLPKKERGNFQKWQAIEPP